MCLCVVGDQVAQREAVVRRDEVDRREGATALAGVEVGRARQPPAELADAGVAAPEVPDVVAVLVVPLGPQRRELADLVAARADVPRLGDELDPAQHRVLLDGRHEVAEHVDVVERAGQRGREVEAEAVDVHLLDPVAQRVHDELQDVRLGDVEGVAAARVVGVVPAAVAQVVVVVVVDAAEGQGRAELVALGRVVVDHVEDDLEPGRVHGLDHALELGDLAAARAGRGVGRVRREVADGVVAPVVREAVLEQVHLVEEVVHGQQLDGGDAERGQVLEHRGVGESRVGAALVLGDRRVQPGDAAHVRLVDDGVAPGRAGRLVVAPVEVRRRRRRSWARTAPSSAALMLEVVAARRARRPRGSAGRPRRWPWRRGRAAACSGSSGGRSAGFQSPWTRKP